MAVYIQKLTKYMGYYRLTLPKALVENLDLDKAKVVEVYEGEGDIIMIKEYNGKKRRS